MSKHTLSPAQLRFLNEVWSHGGDTEYGAEYWPVVNDWVKNGCGPGLGFHNQDRTIAVLTRQGLITIDEDGDFHLTERGLKIRQERKG